MELHDLLILTDFVNDRFDYYLKPDNEQSQTRQGVRGEFVTVRSRLVKTGDEYFRRTKTLYNYVLSIERSKSNQRRFDENILELFR